MDRGIQSEDSLRGLTIGIQSQDSLMLVYPLLWAVKLIPIVRPWRDLTGKGMRNQTNWDGNDTKLEERSGAIQVGSEFCSYTYPPPGDNNLTSHTYAVLETDALKRLTLTLTTGPTAAYTRTTPHSSPCWYIGQAVSWTPCLS
jgi:hypothetical protein